MQNRTPNPSALEPIEHASIDELRSLQLQRLQTTVRRSYDQVPHYRAAFEAAGVHPDDIKDLADLAKMPFTTKSRPAGELSVRHVRGPPSTDIEDPRVLRNHRQGNGRRIHPG